MAMKYVFIWISKLSAKNLLWPGLLELLSFLFVVTIFFTYNSLILYRKSMLFRQEENYLSINRFTENC